MKILYLHNGKNVTDKTLWSGTINRLYNTLTKENEVISLSTNVILLDFIQKIIRKVFGIFKIKNEFLLFSKLKASIISKKILKFDFDYIFAPALSDVIAYVKVEKPIVYLTDSTHNLMDGYYYNNKKKSVMKVLNVLESRTLKNATKVIVSSDWAKNDMINFYKCNPSKIEVIPFYTDFNIKNNSIKTNKEEYNFLFVGVNWKRKGLDKAINTVKYLNEELNIKANLHIIGLECPKDKFYSNCKFYGFLNKNNDEQLEKINCLYNNADLFILPTIAECAGIVFAEASGYGLPIITHDTGGISNYVINDYNGYRLPLNCTYIDYANYVKYLIDNNLLPSMSENCHHLYESTFTEYAWYRHYKNFLNNQER